MALSSRRLLRLAVSLSIFALVGLPRGSASAQTSAGPTSEGTSANPPPAGPAPAGPSADATAKKAEASVDVRDADPTKTPFDDTVEAERAIYLSADLAFTRSDLGLVSDSLGFDTTGANGALYGLSAGYRTKNLRLGARWRVYDTTEFTLWAFALSAGYALPMRPVTPIFSAHVGYVFDQKLQSGLFRSSLPDGNLLPPDVDVKGLLVGVDANASYWLTRWLRLGVFAGVDAMILHRAKAPAPQSIFGPADVSGNPLFTDSGTGVGLNLNLGIRGAFDIGLR